MSTFQTFFAFIAVISMVNWKRDSFWEGKFDKI